MNDIEQNIALDIFLEERNFIFLWLANKATERFLRRRVNKRLISEGNSYRIVSVKINFDGSMDWIISKYIEKK